MRLHFPLQIDTCVSILNLKYGVIRRPSVPLIDSWFPFTELIINNWATYMSLRTHILCIKFKITTILLTQLHVRVSIWLVYQNTYMIAHFIKVPLPSQQESNEQSRKSAVRPNVRDRIVSSAPQAVHALGQQASWRTLS